MDSAGEPLAPRLAPYDDGNCQHVLDHVRVHLTGDPSRVDAGVGRSRVCGMALLPEEFRRPQEQPWSQLPADDVRPLVEQQSRTDMTIVPRTGPLSASSALAMISWYHWGKFVAAT